MPMALGFRTLEGFTEEGVVFVTPLCNFGLPDCLITTLGFEVEAGLQYLSLFVSEIVYL